MMSIYDDLNPDWIGSDLTGWEPWEEPEPDDGWTPGGCEYCANPDVRDTPEPFGGKPCCDDCFVVLIGDPGGEPWRCGTDLKIVSVPPSADAVTGPTLPAAGLSEDASVSLTGLGTPRLGSGHQERKEGQ